MKKLFLGIDTSNYKTSVSVVDNSGDIVYNRSEFLNVKSGERGLRQSDAFFQHSNALPDFIYEAFDTVAAGDIAAVGVSATPRRIENSYMPCFLAGINAAKEISAALSLELYSFSHQEGHAAAVLEKENTDRCIFCHFSGGTSEILLCNKDDAGYSMEIIGGTRDISIGQLLDRTGVAMGFQFPSGKFLDIIASEYESDECVLPKIKYADGYFNLSGIETKLMRLVDSYDEEKIKPVISELFDKIAELVFRNLTELSAAYKVDTVWIAGGVGASTSIRSRITKLIKDYKNSNYLPDFKFGEPELCGDNAVGTALLCRRIYENE
ncbi:MAG: hypothetical protein KBS63_06000 [Clostridiales bacterium]|nr:hypothetical protein [Candidatus Crickella caballi]